MSLQSVCVSVSHSVSTISFPRWLSLYPRRIAGDGDTCIASPSMKLAIHGEDISSGRGTDVPAFNTLTPLVHPAAVLSDSPVVLHFPNFSLHR